MRMIVSFLYKGCEKMSNEIKIVYQDADEALSKLRASTQAVKASFESVKGENVLDMVMMVNELNVFFQNFVKEYQTLLLENEKATRDSIQAMKTTDEQIAASIK